MMLGQALQRWAACLDMHSARVCTLAAGDGWLVLGLLCLVFVAVGIGRKLVTVLLTLRAMALAPVLSRRLSKWGQSYDYADEEFLRADGAGEPWLELRHKALDRLAMFFQAHYAKSMAWGNAIRESFSDLRFTDANRVPFPFRRVMRDKFNLCSVVTASKGPITRPRWASEPGPGRLLWRQCGGI